MKYLRQLKTGHIYLWTKVLAKRSDMAPLSIETAEKRIKALKGQITQRQEDIIAGNKSWIDDTNKATKFAQTLNDLEARKNSLEEKVSGKKDIKEVQEDKAKENDLEIKQIRKMTTKNQVEEYVLRKFGQDIDRRKNIEDLKASAEELRLEQIEEGK